MKPWRGRDAAQWVGSLGDSEPAEGPLVPNPDAVACVAEQIRAEHERQARRVRWRRPVKAALAGLTFVAAAAAILMIVRKVAPTTATSGLVEVRAFERQVTLDGKLAPEHVLRGDALRAGQTVVTGSDAHAVLDIVEGGTLELGSFSDLRLMTGENKQQLSAVRLGRGSVGVDLPKLTRGRTFDVNTPDAKVSVVGTKFEVRVVEAQRGPLTCVSVVRGMVHVIAAERAALLSAGQRWASQGDLSACDPPSPASPSSARLEVERREPSPSPSAEAAAPLRRTPAGPSAVGTGTLAEENRLFLELVRARREGRNADAISLQRRFLARFPRSVLAAQVVEEQRRTSQ